MQQAPDTSCHIGPSQRFNTVVGCETILISNIQVLALGSLAAVSYLHKSILFNLLFRAIAGRGFLVPR